jgi:hypothetical protein
VKPETEASSAPTTARLLVAVLAFWVIGGLLTVVMMEVLQIAMTRGRVAFVISALLVVPAAILLALKTAKYRKLKPAVQTIGVLAIAGLASWILTDGVTRLGIVVFCASFPAGFFAAVWLGPEGERRRAK